MSNSGKPPKAGTAPGPALSNAPGVKEPKSVTKNVDKPDWANGLKQFYDSVVDEPLPDELADLLAKFDDGDGE